MKYASRLLQFSILLDRIDGHSLDLVGEVYETKSSVD